jgi:adenylate cyclase
MGVMALSSAVVDLTVDPIAERRRRRRALFHIGLPIGGVALMIVLILLIAIYSSRANQRDVLALSDELLVALDSRISLAVSTYLDPAARVVGIAKDIFHDRAIDNQRSLAIDYGTIVLNGVPQIADLLFADGTGNHMMVRHGETGGIDVKLIRNTPEPRQVTWTHYDTLGKITGDETDPSDTYDPRTRPWFTGATGTDDLFWTGAYVFFTDRKPGVTVSMRYLAPDQKIYVFAVDIALDVISKFLSSLEIGRTGRAFIIDSSGRLVASPSGSVMVKQGEGDPVAARLDELDDPVLTRAYDEYRVEGHGRHAIEVDGRRYIISVTPLPNAGRDWSVLIVVPEKDFIGFVTSNNRNALLMSLSVVAVAIFLAILLIRQGVRADRNARRVAERQHALDRQSTAFANLAADASLFDPAQREPPRTSTEILADVAVARRVSLWRLTGGNRILHCEDSFDRTTKGHVDGLDLHRDELPQFFAHLLKGEPVTAADAARDPRTAEMFRLLMESFGTRSLTVTPIRHGAAVVGAICLEDAVQTAAAHDFIVAVANMSASRMALMSDTVARSEPRSVAQTAGERHGTMRSFTAELRARGTDPETLEAEVYSDVAVMVLHFTDPVVMATRLGEGTRCSSNEIVCAIQEIADQNGIPYLKIVGQDVVAAAGLDRAGGDAASQIADAAVAIRDRCIALFEDSARPQAFRIGIDCGVAMGSTLGATPSVFNLWGESVHTAGVMAASTLPGTVQVTESAYHALRQDFLFRPRGRFYLPRAGEIRTFILASRL